MDLQLTGKRAVVTGGSRGIGFAIADTLAAEGADTALLARDPDRLEAASHRLLRHGRRILALAADTTDDAEVRAAIARAVQELGGVDILVNSAAEPAGPGTPRALAARTVGTPSGSIRNVAVAALTKSLADELGPSGINVTVVHPGVTVTERTPALIAGSAVAQGITAAEAEARLAAQNSIGRIVTAAEVADVVAFLASPRSIAINGDAIAAGGGAPGAIHY
jgi:NAD(P)-dependent dehydrogenase (short-subunit alcohol dehydrogenase family)